MKCSICGKKIHKHEPHNEDMQKIVDANEKLVKELKDWLHEKQAIPRRYDNENRRTKRTQSRAGVSG